MLNEAPYLQVAIDIPYEHQALELAAKLPRSPRVLIEAGTPLIKFASLKVVEKLKGFADFVLADTKTLDVGALEAELAYKVGANAASVAAAAPIATINNFIARCRELGIAAVLDSINCDPLAVIEKLDTKPHVVELHRAIDEDAKAHLFDLIPKIKELGLKVAIAGGITPESAKQALARGADIVVVGRYITGAPDPAQKAREVMEAMGIA